MNTLLNRFTLVGTLKECRIDLFQSHIKARFNIEIKNQYEITIYYSINKQFHQDKYNDFIKLISDLHPTINGWIWCNNKKYYCTTSNISGKETNLFISGNITEYNKKIYFNAEYIRLSKANSDISCNLEGIVIDKNHILNIVSDSPRVFEIENNINPSDQIYLFNLLYLFPYRKEEELIYSKNYNENLKILNYQKINKTISYNEIKNYLLEWEIINSDV